MPKKMVSESNILGKPPLIFVTVGTTLFPFTRLFKALDIALETIDNNPLVIVQSKVIDYKWRYKNVKIYKEFSPSKLTTYIKNAHKIITHAGLGSIHMISMQSTAVMPLIIARKSSYKEHVDDHQVQFAKFCQKKVNKMYKNKFLFENDISKQIQIYLHEKCQSNLLSTDIFPESNKKMLQKNLASYIKDQIKSPV